VDAVAAVGHGGRSGAEPQVDPWRQPFPQQMLEIGPHDVQQAPRWCELGGPYTGAPAPVLVDEARLVEVVGDVLDRGQQAHRLGGVVARAEEVDHVPLRPGTGRQLQQHDVAAERRHPVRQGQPGDPGPADHDLHPRSSFAVPH
jgi:hypothetical protein